MRGYMSVQDVCVRACVQMKHVPTESHDASLHPRSVRHVRACVNVR